MTAGPPATVIDVTGGQFNPNEQTTLYWDTPSHVAGSATADGGGSFNTRVKPFAGDAPGVHHLCASVQPHPCANFTLQSATPSPSPSQSPTDQSPSPSASPVESPALIASPARVTNNLNGFDVISRPPFVFLPIFGLGALLLSLGYWAVSVARRPRRLAPLPSAAVVHRATRPDYAAGFGTPPPSPAAQPQASAWDEPMRTVPPSAAPPASAAPAPAVPEQPSEQPVEWGAPVEWGTGNTGGWGIPEPPPEPPEEDESPEAPTPAD